VLSIEDTFEVIDFMKTVVANRFGQLVYLLYEELLELYSMCCC